MYNLRAELNSTAEASKTLVKRIEDLMKEIDQKNVAIRACEKEVTSSIYFPSVFKKT
jgi:hypothetical protein